MKPRFISIALLAALAVSGAVVAAPTSAIAQRVPTSTTTAMPDPAARIHEMARLFRAGDVVGLAHDLVPPSKWEEARLAYQDETAATHQ